MNSRFLNTLVFSALCGALSTWSAADNLEEIYKLALRNDPTILAAEAQYKAGLESEKVGRSGLLPQINLGGDIGVKSSAFDGEEFFVGDVVELDNDKDTDYWNLGATLSQAVFDMPTWFSFTQGKELTRQAQAQFAADQQDLIVRTADAYFSVLRALDNLRASRLNETASERQFDQTEQRFEVGLIAITDVHESRAVYDLAIAQRLSDEGELGVALERLSILTGQTHDNVWLLKSDYPVVDPQPADKNEWVEFALDNNFSIKASAYARDAANERAKGSKAEHYPKIAAQLGADIIDNSSSLNNKTTLPGLPQQATKGDISNQTQSWGASLNLKVPLYSGGYISASRRQAYEEFNRAQETYAGNVRNTVQATRALHLRTTVDVATIKARKLAVTSNKSAYDATQAGYEVGTRNIVDVLNVQQLLFDAIRNYANARYDYVLDMLKLKREAGIISPKDIQELNRWLVAPQAPTMSGTGLKP